MLGCEVLGWWGQHPTTSGGGCCARALLLLWFARGDSTGDISPCGPQGMQPVHHPVGAQHAASRALTAPPWQRTRSHSRALEASNLLSSGPGSEPGVPTRPRCGAAGAAALPCRGEHHGSGAGAGRRARCSAPGCPPRSAAAGGLLGWLGRPRSLLFSSLQPEAKCAGKRSGSAPALGSLLLPTFPVQARPGSGTLRYLSRGSLESRLRKQLLGKGARRKEGDGQE